MSNIEKKDETTALKTSSLCVAVPIIIGFFSLIVGLNPFVINYDGVKLSIVLIKL